MSEHTDPTSAGPDGRDESAEATDDASRLSTAPRTDAEREAAARRGGAAAGGDPAGAGSFGGIREPGLRGGLTWTGREAVGWARWIWRQLTSMRVALILLFLLALATVPGSLIPQEGASPVAAAELRENNPTLASVYDRLQLFDVYSSVWFSAIYLLLFASLIGCILPRAWQFVGQLRGRPPRAPRRLDRMPAYTTWRTEAAPREALVEAERLLRRSRFRVDGSGVPASEDAGAAGGSVAAEKGYLREAGNLVFHVALVVMLIAFAAGALYRSEGGKLVTVGSGFTNTLTQYDDFSSGTLFDVDDLERFTFDLDEFHADFVREGPDLGSARDFRADITYWRDGDTEGTEASVRVNHPLHIGDAKVYLLGHGFAPRVTLVDGQGEVAFSGPVPFIPQDNALSSTGVVKVTDYVGPDGEPDQMAFQGFFNPTFALTAERGPHSTFPDPDFPALTLNAYHGNLGLDSGIPQNVYQLDTRYMEQLTDEDGEPLRINLLPGEEWELPDDRGTLTFEGFDRWATFQVSSSAGNGWALIGAVGAVGGLAASLLIQRRRLWVRATTGADGVTVVEMASLGRSESARVPEELAELALALQPAAPMLPEADASGSDEAEPDAVRPGESDESDGPDEPDEADGPDERAGGDRSDVAGASDRGPGPVPSGDGEGRPGTRSASGTGTAGQPPGGADAEPDDTTPGAATDPEAAPGSRSEDLKE
ncbi:cytochrome c biogenesis protein ResB [Streptomyces lonarensis]|uniref:cytochrome c biogenesis protein ResB n=1 Tax=Streptomyces lonarensis TaxID=700599 RepID=UPI00247307B9|nr:cytochrome c biogenesis protein ResB [Streptomyces lonarensis]